MQSFVPMAAGMLAAIPLCALGAPPQTQTTPAPATQLPGIQVTGHAPQPYPITFVAPDEVRRLQGVYDMDNGAQVLIDVRGRVLFVDLDGRITPLRAVARNVFVSQDRQMALAVADTDLATVAISYTPRGGAPVMLAGGPHPEAIVRR